MMDRDSSIDSNLSNNTGKDRPARKSTIHDLYASREKHRAKSVKACRATAEQIIHNSNAKISNMDVLFRHEVSKDRCWIWPIMAKEEVLPNLMILTNFLAIFQILKKQMSSLPLLKLHPIYLSKKFLINLVTFFQKWPWQSLRRFIFVS